MVSVGDEDDMDDWMNMIVDIIWVYIMKHQERSLNHKVDGELFA